MRFPRTKFLRRSILSATLLVTPVAASATDQSDGAGFLQGLITGRRAAPSEPARNDSNSSTVQAELQKLFQTGRVQTSEHQTRVGTASVQQVQHQSSEESGGLFRQIFGGPSLTERRAQRLQERAERLNPQTANRVPSVPKPPPIDFAMQQRSRRKSSSLHARPAGYANEAAPPAAPPVGALSDRQVTLKPATVEEFVSPFIDDGSRERPNVKLDLDSLVDRPADRSEAMPITTDGDAVQRLIELPIPMADLLQKGGAVSLPAAGDVPADELSEEPVEPVEVAPSAESEDVLNDERVMRAESNDEGSAVATVDDSVDDSVEVEVVPTEPARRLVSDSAVMTDQDPTDGSDVTVDELPAEESAKTQEAEPELEVVDGPVEVSSEQANVSSGGDKRLQSINEENARRQQQRYLILSRSGQSGFKGFCPVALRESRTLRDSSKNHQARFGLKTYQFSSEEARARFEADPARYAPAAGGSDVVLLMNTGEETEGSLDFCLWYRDRLYMFRSRDTQAIFSADPARFANQY